MDINRLIQTLKQSVISILAQGFGEIFAAAKKNTIHVQLFRVSKLIYVCKLVVQSLIQLNHRKKRTPTFLSHLSKVNLTTHPKPGASSCGV